MSAVERCEKGRGATGSGGRVSPHVCACVSAWSSDCQCCATLQVKQCRIIRDTEGHRGGGREAVR